MSSSMTVVEVSKKTTEEEKQYIEKTLYKIFRKYFNSKEKT